MQYRLYDNDRKNPNMVANILEHRGISDWQKYLNLDNSVVIDYNKLGNIKSATKVYHKHITDNRSVISIIVDTDVDGYTSASAIYNYTKKVNPKQKLNYIMHKQPKSHGISDLKKDIIIPEDTTLLIIPDAATNDHDACKELASKGIDIIILDHHEAEEDGWKNNDQSGVIIVNNQMSPDYSNKDLSGVGIVYRFMQAYDDEELFGDGYADDFLDLVALGNIGDVMKMTSFETKYFVQRGLDKIQNKAFQALIKSQDYSMNSIVNIHNVQWFIVPVLNGCIRMGTREDKDLVFRAFIETDENFEYNKRATKSKPAETIQESIYDRAARLSKNAKNRQDKARDKSFADIVKLIEKEGLDVDNKVILVDVTNVLENRSLTGVLAIKVSEMYQKPCILVKKRVLDDNSFALAGSARSYNHCPIDNFKDITNGTERFTFATGHASAFGVEIKEENFDAARDVFNEILKDVIYDKTYLVDYIFRDPMDANIKLAMDVSKLDNYLGQGIDEPLVAVENINLSRSDVLVCGSKNDTIVFTLDNDMKYIKFKCKEGDQLYDWARGDIWGSENNLPNDITITVIGVPSISTFNNLKTPQIMIKDVEITSDITDIDEDDWWN